MKKKIKILSLGFIGLIVVLCTILILLPSPIHKTGFQNLQELQSYTKSKNEMEPMSNNNTLKPEFNAYYKSLTPTLWQKTKEKISKAPAFSPSFFKTLLQTMAKEHENKGRPSGRFICKIQTSEKSRFILFGCIQGALHSLTRDLEQLQVLNLINTQFELIQEDTYIIFMGDVISRSCYTMETMALVMRIVQANPDRAFYLRGNHESDNYWQEHTLKTELQMRAADLSKQQIPLELEVNKFFDTLPEAAYLTIPGKPNEFIRISDSSRAKSENLHENNFATFLTQKSSTVDYLALKKSSENETTESSIIIKAIFHNEKKRESFQPMEGLRLLAPDMDSVAWNILSCPTYVYQRAIKFHFDAFVILQANKDITEWTINLYNRDAQTKNPFKVTTYNMLSAKDIATNKTLERDKPKKPEAKKEKIARSLPPTLPKILTEQEEQVVQLSSVEQTESLQQTPPAQKKTEETLEKIAQTLSKINETMEKISRSQERKDAP